MRDIICDSFSSGASRKHIFGHFTTWFQGENRSLTFNSFFLLDLDFPILCEFRKAVKRKRYLWSHKIWAPIFKRNKREQHNQLTHTNYTYKNSNSSKSNMRISTVLWLSMAAAAPSLSQAGFFGWGSNDTEDASTVDNSSPKAGKRFIHDIIHDERRYLLFNSRQLSGECSKYRNDLSSK